MTSILKSSLLVLSTIIVLTIAVVVLRFEETAKITEASAPLSESNYSTTTGSTAEIGNSSDAQGTPILLKNGYGQFAAVVVTGQVTNGGHLFFYDATTSDITMRTGNRATSSLMLADVLGNVSANTYQYDIQINDGLLLVAEGLVPTSTIMWK